MALIHTAALAALLSAAAVHGGRTDVTPPPELDDVPTLKGTYAPVDGFSAGTCMHERYAFYHPESTLTCDVAKKDGKFWTRVSLKASETCVEGRRLKVEDLAFGARFKGDRRDFAVFAYTGDDGTLAPDTAPIYGDSCAVQSLTSIHDTSVNPLATISDVDGDTCHDVTLSPDSNTGEIPLGTSVETDIEFADAFTIPCTDYATPAEIAAYDAALQQAMDTGLPEDQYPKRTVKLQFCSSWRGVADDNNCDAIGPHPCSTESCWCDTIDLGVEIVRTEDAVPTCAPNKDMSASPSEGPTNAVGAAATPAPTTASPSKSPSVGPTAAPTDKPVTASPSKSPSAGPTKAPTDEPTTASPSKSPSVGPTAGPTAKPVTSSPTTSSPTTSSPTTASPSKSPSAGPTASPTTASPSKGPTDKPTTAVPTGSPTCDNSTITAVDDAATTDMAKPVTVLVLANDIPVEGWEDLTVTTLPFTGRHGVCTIGRDGQDVEYTPDAGYYGSDTCVYEACDGYPKKRCDVATITITINAPEDAPVALDDFVTTDKNIAVDISPLTNDTAVAGHDLKVSAITEEAAHGECVVTADDMVKYVPEPGFVGSDSCVYEACDDRSKCDTATIYVTIVGADGPCDDDKQLGTKSPTPAPTAEIGAVPAPTAKPTPSPTTSPVTSEPTPSPTKSPVSAEPTPSPSKSPVTSEPTPSPTKSPVTAEPTPSPTKKPVTPEPTGSPSGSPICGGPNCETPTGNFTITTEPTTAPPSDTPSAAPSCSGPKCERPTGNFTFTIEPTTAPPTVTPEVIPEPTMSPTTPAPTTCGGRKWTYEGGIGCTNKEEPNPDSVKPVYDSAEDCCGAIYGGMFGCTVVDTCQPTASPTPSPTDEPTPSPTKRAVDTLEPTEPFPTFSPVAMMKTAPPVQIQSTPIPTATGTITFDTPKPTLATPAQTNQPSWGGTPTVGTDATKKPVGARPRRKRGLRNMRK